MHLRALVSAGLFSLLAGSGPLLAQTPPDVSASLQTIGNPFAQFNVLPLSRQVNDFRYYHGRVYLTYGNTSTDSRANRFLYGDPATLTVGEETASFVPNNEELTRFRVINDTLLLHADDFVGSSKGYYTRDAAGVWRFHVVASGTDHSRDVIHFNDRVWFSNARDVTSVYPNMFTASLSDPARAFTLQNQLAPTGYTSPLSFIGFYFTFSGRLYAAGANNTNAPFLLRYNGNDIYQPNWEIIRATASSFFSSGTANLGPYLGITSGFVKETVEVIHNAQRRLLFIGRNATSFDAPFNTLYSITDLENGLATAIALPGALTGNVYHLALVRREGRVFVGALRYETNNTATVQIHQLTPGADPALGASWVPILRFTTSAALAPGRAAAGSLFDYAAGRFYFAADTGYNPSTGQAFGGAADVGTLYSLPFANVLGPVADVPPASAFFAPPAYILDDYDLLRPNRLTAGSGVTFSVGNQATADADSELLVTRTSNSSALTFATYSTTRTNPLVRALLDGSALSVRVQAAAGENAADLRLRWSVATDAWTTAPASGTRTFSLVTIPAASASDQTLVLDLDANPAIGDALANYAAGAGTFFRLVLDNGGGSYFSGAVRFTLDDLRIALPAAPVVPSIPLAQADVTAYGTGQDGGNSKPTSATVSTDGRSITLAGNAWKKVPFTYPITPNTRLEVTLDAANAGEILGLALDNDNTNTNTPRRAFRFGGTDATNTSHDTWSWLVTPAYVSGSGARTYTVNVGTYITGTNLQVNWLGFILDDDAAGAANATFSDIRLYEP